MAEMHRVGIVGGGTMGQGIAAFFAQAGLEVLVCEQSEALAEIAQRKIGEFFDHEITRWALTAGDKRALLKKIAFTSDLKQMAPLPLIIEAVPEEAPIKTKVFQELAKICPPQTIFVTNSSTLSITEMASQLPRKERFIGVHFMNPVTKTKLVELVRGLHTSDETYQTVRELLVGLGKNPIEVYESPGYVTTRVIVPMINEAMQVVMEGVATAEDVDTAIKLGYNMDIGPLALADRMGLDELLKWMEHLFRELGDLKYRPCPMLRQKVRAGQLGVKTGRGFFEYK